MNKVEFKGGTEETKGAYDVAIGQAFMGRVGFRTDAYELNLRTFSGVVSLSNPSRTWLANSLRDDKIKVHGYRPVDVTFVVEGQK